MTENPTHPQQADREPPGEPEVEPATPPVREEPAVEPTEPPKKDPVRTWTLIIFLLIVVLLGWYLVADRLTPYSTQGRLHAVVVPIVPQISGLVEDVLVTNNQVVTEGDVLFTVNTDDYKLQLAAAEADRQVARQSVGASTAAISAAEASVKAARASLTRADQDLVRMRGIRAEDPGAISERRLQVSEASRMAAEASVEAAKANLEKARQDLGLEGDNNVRILQAEVSIADAELNIERSTVYAPDDGVVIDVRLDTGNFAAAGAPQMTFVTMDDVWVQVDFTENNLGLIKPGDSVELIFDVQPGRVYEGTVRGTGFGVEVGSAPLGSLPTIENDKNWLRDAQRFPVLVDFESDHLGDMNVRVGSQVSVIVYTGVHPFMNTLGRLRIRVATYLSYAY